MKMTEMKGEHQTLITQGVKNAFGQDSWELVEALTLGHSPSSIYKLRIDGRDYIAKFSDPNHPHNNLMREYHAQGNAVEKMAAPAVHYNDPSVGIIIMDYVNIVVVDRENRRQPEMIEKFSQFVRRLHSCASFQKAASIYQRVEFVHDQLPSDFQSSELVKLSLQIKEEVQRKLIDKDDLKPCHRDIHPFNLLYDCSDFWLIDWTAAAQENFYFDLASCVTFFFFQNNGAAEMFLNAYFKRSLNQNEKDKFNLMQAFVYVYFGLMLIFNSCVRKANLLSQKEIDKLPSYSQFMDSIESGEVNLGCGKSQQRLGFIFFKMAKSAYNNQAFKDGATRLKIDPGANLHFTQHI